MKEHREDLICDGCGEKVTEVIIKTDEDWELYRVSKYAKKN